MSKICKWCGNVVSNSECVDFNADGVTYEICDTCVNRLSGAKAGRVTVEEIAYYKTDPDLKDFFLKRYETKQKTPAAKNIPYTPKENTVSHSGESFTENNTPCTQAPAFGKKTTDSFTNVSFGAEDALWKIAEDVRFLRNVVLVSLILGGVSLLGSIIMTILAAA